MRSASYIHGWVRKRGAPNEREKQRPWAFTGEGYIADAAGATKGTGACGTNKVFGMYEPRLFLSPKNAGRHTNTDSW